jgi:ABC-type lipoprotein export system ATPase subunit
VEIPALRGVDLVVERGTFTAIEGRSGSGKTTLLNLIGGLDRPTSGEVYFDGINICELSERELTELRRRRIGFVFQSFALIPILSAYENVELPLRIAGVRRKERVKRVWRCLEMVGLTNWAHHRPYELSGGQQQRLAIARALAIGPDLILADEPTGELDSATGHEIMALLRRIVTRGDVTVIVATHDPMVEDYASVIYELSDGRICRSRLR